MPHQVALTVITKIKPGSTQALKRYLGRIRTNRDRPPIIPFKDLSNVHFARWMVLEETTDLDGNPLPPQLVYLSNVDAPLSTHMEELATVAGEDLDKIYDHCLGYPAVGDRTPETRIVFLRSHQVASKPFYVNTIGRSVQQILQEEQLRQTLRHFLDSQDWQGRQPEEVRAAIQNFVELQLDLSWAKFPPEAPDPGWQLRENLHKFGLPLLLLPFLPLIVLLLLPAALLLRFHERREIPDPSSADPETANALRNDEDFGVQNQVVAIGHFKRGWFRKITSVVVLELADYLIRHFFTQGSLSGLNTIHFARWVTLDSDRRLFFTSNYDGSLESYMNDFIDKAAWGLNAIFSNGEGFPKTRFLFFEGIRDEQAYKRFLPTRQIPSQVWYSAYPHLSTENIKNNAAIRAELFSPQSHAETVAWLRRL